MGINIRVDGDVLARSRFASTPAVEVLATLRGRHRPPVTPTGAVHHTARWNRRAADRLDPATLRLLHALYPADHPYTPDFLTPRPTSTRATIGDVVEAIAATPEEVVEYHLDIGLDGRPVRPEVSRQFVSEEHYRRWRRAVPTPLAGLLRAGPAALAEEAARAVQAFFAAALAEDWPVVSSIVGTDIAVRGEQISAHGWGGMLEDLGDLTWTGSELIVDRPFEGVVDWADDGILFLPSTGHSGPVLFSAERPHSPVMTYPASGTAALWSGGRATTSPPEVAIEGVIGRGRRAILVSLDRPRTTRDLSRIDGRSESTISYHLNVLARAGLVTKRRSGRGVAYRRTALAETLVGTEPAGPGPRRSDAGDPLHRSRATL